jgi:putative glutamine amidotransferase
MTRSKPVRIGLSARIFHPEPDAKGIRSKTLQVLEQSVAQWVTVRDVLLLMVPSVVQDGVLLRSNIRLRDYAEHLDGLILQGGADVSPRAYGEEPLRPEWSGDPVRDAYELELLHEFMEARKPVLGICRGMQLINVALGGSLYQDIATEVAGASAHQTADYDRHVHEVRFSAGGLLARLWPEHDGGGVVSIHHQAVRALGRDLEVEAVCPHDGLVEAIRGKGRGFLLGVQWHPEFHHPGDAAVLDMTPLLDAFIEAARKRRW